MNVTPKGKTIGICAAAAVFLYTSGLMVILTPVPLLYVSIAYGRRSGVSALVIAASAVALIYYYTIPVALSGAGGMSLPVPVLGLAGFLSGEVLAFMGVGYFLFFAAIAMTIHHGVIRKWKLMRLGGTAVAAGISVILCVSLFLAMFGSDEVAAGMRSYVLYVLNHVIELNSAAGASGTQMGFLAERGDAIAAFVMRIVPALVFVYTFLTVFLSLLIGKRILMRYRSVTRMPSITGFRLPDNFVWPVIGCGLLFFLNHYLLQVVMFEFLAANGLIVLLSLFFFQGMAVVVFMLRGVRPAIFRTIAYVMIILFFQSVSLVIIAIGLADIWVNFRLRTWRLGHNESN